MFRKDQFGFVFNTIFALFFSFALTAFTHWQKGQLTLAALIPAFVCTFAVNYTLSCFIPIIRIGGAFAALFTKKEESLLFYLLRTFMNVLIMVAGVLFFMLFIEMGFSADLLPTFVRAFPSIFAVAFVIAVFCGPLLEKLAHRLCSK